MSVPPPFPKSPLPQCENVCTFEWRKKKSELIHLCILFCSLSSSTSLLSPRHVLSCLRHRLGGRLPSLGESLSSSSLVFLLVNNSGETQKGPKAEPGYTVGRQVQQSLHFLFIFFWRRSSDRANQRTRMK